MYGLHPVHVALDVFVIVKGRKFPVGGFQQVRILSHTRSQSSLVLTGGFRTATGWKKRIKSLFAPQPGNPLLCPARLERTVNLRKV